MQAETLFPAPLKQSDKIAILAPSGPVKREYVDGADAVIRSLGFEPVVYPTVDMHNGQFSGLPEERFADLKDAFTDPSVRAILCARGGYGLVHIMDSIAALPIEQDPKWVIGYSDISALHAVMASKGVASIHASMARHVARGASEPENVVLFDILNGEMPEYEFAPDPLNHLGEAQGKVIGGNLAVIQALINTPYDMIQPGTILFIEDVSEPIYKVERIMYQLRMSGILSKLKGLIIGQFTDYKADDNHTSMEEMLSEVLSDYPDLPVVFNAPIGHVSYNIPMIESAEALLTVTPAGVTLRYLPFSPQKYGENLLFSPQNINQNKMASTES